MNSYMGIYPVPGYSPTPPTGGYRVFVKVSELGNTFHPHTAFVFGEESMLTLNDGYLSIFMSGGTLDDLVGSYHGGSGAFSFADGHAELRRWKTGDFKQKVVKGSRIGSGYPVANGANNEDLGWLRSHTTILN